MKVYTKTGDKGTSQLFSGERRRKDDAVFMALGDTDELNAQIGVALTQFELLGIETTLHPGVEFQSRLEEIQSRLFDVGASVATPLSSAGQSKIRRAEFEPSNVTVLETWIDEMDEHLEPLRNFILPSGGGLASCQLHVARAVCRRAERRVVSIGGDDVDPVVIQYLNRLSDFLFVAARFVAFLEGKSETIWKKQVKPTS
ncbi:ATP:cob(I)alamin adenosyltransferase [Aphanomyces invadans]|uniref:Corrinoid adenosyltransferase MMAB n=1 Tax=Aphanomyces invadans TaxID=157072 RepID=A0A024UTF9_9STRA|nr:ATP:cob(I)alamin adenosyltransferase [Aphanomyces invadans]ETW08898.1 ATP:cob(I)alamin adenosyltransferase [Aphanomyces invadans]|eukprot:XP_008862703.1 ATP:cob(I)alamin adenosyltransferase [Aphanomyces invadans]